MTDFIIKTHRNELHYNQPHFFILNKGNNSGKPLKQPCPNCFVIIFKCEQAAENYFFIAQSLWMVRHWHLFLCGSVIPFLKLSDFSKNFTIQSNHMMEDYTTHQKNVAALKLLEQNQNKLENNLQLIKELRTVIIKNCCKSITR